MASPTSVPTGLVITSLPASFPSGQVYILKQDSGDGTLGTTISQLNGGNVNAITPATAQQYGFTYQLVEATLSSNSGDLGDISALNTFGIPVALSDSNGMRSFAPGTSGSQIKSFLNTQGPGSLQSSSLAVGPAQGSTVTPNP